METILLFYIKGESIIDSIGQVGSAADFAKDVTLVRNSNVLTGDTNINDAFDRNIEWTNPKEMIFLIISANTPLAMPILVNQLIQNQST